MKTPLIWEQLALGGRGGEVFVFKCESDNLLGFVHKIELAHVNFNSETFQEPWEEGPLYPTGVFVGPLRTRQC